MPAGIAATMCADIRACDVLTSRRRLSSMRSPTMLNASDSKPASGAPVRCDTLSAKVTSERPGASMRTSRSSSASVAEMPQSIAAATRKNSVCTGSCTWAPTKRMPCASECPEASDMDNAVNASGMASSTSCCSRRRSKVSRAAPTPNGATSPKAKPMGDNDATASKTLQIPLDSSRNARRAALSSIANPRRSAGIERRPRAGNLCQQVVFHQLTRQLLRHRFERLAHQLRRRHPRHTRLCPTRRRDGKPRQTPYDEGHSESSIRPPPLA